MTAMRAVSTVSAHKFLPFVARRLDWCKAFTAVAILAKGASIEQVIAIKE